MKKLALLLILLGFTTMACGLTVSLTPTETPNQPAMITATTVPVIIVTATPAVTNLPPTDVPATATPESQGDAFDSCANLSVTLPSALGVNGTCNTYPRQDGADLAWWQKNPGYAQIDLGADFPVRGKSNAPVINVYSANDYALLSPAAFESIHRLDNYILGDQSIASLDEVPGVPFYNSKLAFAANMQKLEFQNGSGIRYIGQYSDAPVPANNNDLFYAFIGVSGDGEKYVVAIFPLTNPVLVESGDPNASIPPGGIPFTFGTDPDNNLNSYYSSVSSLLNAQPSESFTPGLQTLDALIRSMYIN